MKRWLALGSIALLVLGGLVPTLALAQDDSTGTIGYGQPVQGTITDDEYEFNYTFSASAGDVITISAVEIANTYLSLELQLIDSSGEVIHERDRWLPIYTLLPFEIPADGDYTLRLVRSGGADGSSSGNFVVLVDLAQINPLEPGTPVEGRLSIPANTHFWEYAGMAGEIMSVRAEGVGIEFVVIQPDGGSLRSRGPETNPAEDFILLPDDGTYLLALQTETLDGTDYTLDVNVYEPEPLEVGTPAEGVIGAGLPSGYFSLRSTPDELLRLEVASDDEDFDGVIRVYNDRGNQRSGTSYSEESEYELLIEPWVAPEIGTYYVIVGADDDVDTETPYTLTARPSLLTPLELGMAGTGFLNDEVRRTGFALPGTAEQQVRMIVTVVDGVCAPNVRVRNNETTGYRVTSNYWSTVFTADMVFPSDAFYIFEFERTSSSDDCEFTIQVDPLDTLLDDAGAAAD